MNYAQGTRLCKASLAKKADKKAIVSLMTSVGLSPDNRKKVRYYSLGMRQRLAIAQAIMEDPAILLLDEPLNGLDYEGVKTVYDILKVQKERGKIILVASHHEEDIRLLCDEVYWLKDGILERIEDISEYTRFKEEWVKKRKPQQKRKDGPSAREQRESSDGNEGKCSCDADFFCYQE